MDDERPTPSDPPDEPAAPEWRVDAQASLAQLRAAGPAGPAGRLLYTDERGRQRRLPADVSTLSGAEIMAAAKAMAYELGAAEPSHAQIAAIERLNELRASGRFSAEDYEREKRRILGRS